MLGSCLEQQVGPVHCDQRPVQAFQHSRGSSEQACTTSLHCTPVHYLAPRILVLQHALTGNLQ
jgi:hypothetical protein